MVRMFPMTNKAKQALWSKLSDKTPFIPTMFYVEGDAEEGYSVSYVDISLCGFNLIKNDGRIRTLYCVKRIIEHINTVGYPTDYNQLLDMRSFAWHSHPMPIQPYQQGIQQSLSL